MILQVRNVFLLAGLLVISFLTPVVIGLGHGGLASVFDADMVRAWLRQEGVRSSAGEVRSADVALIHHVLAKDLGRDEKVFAKYFNLESVAALKQFQKKYGLVETGILDEVTKAKMNALYEEDYCPKIGREDGLSPHLRLVGKGRALPSWYIPNSLVILGGDIQTKGKVCTRVEVAQALKVMFTEALKENIPLMAVSGYRRHDIQQSLHRDIVARQGAKGAQEIALPGESEHQLGLAVDIASVDYESLDVGFAKTKSGKWLAQNAWKYGFVLSFPQGDEKLTGITFEPWHYRYVGIPLAKLLKERGVSLSRFIEEGFSLAMRE